MSRVLCFQKHRFPYFPAYRLRLKRLCQGNQRQGFKDRSMHRTCSRLYGIFTTYRVHSQVPTQIKNQQQKYDHSPADEVKVIILSYVV